MIASFNLEGIKIIDMSAVFAGPTATRLFADWGADVIHIGNPDGRPDTALLLRPNEVDIPTIDYRIENRNRNKRDMSINIANETGRKILYKMLSTADIFVTSYRPRDLEKLKLEYETLSKVNPRIITGNLSGYGKKGPDKDIPAYETTAYFPRSGMLDIMKISDLSQAQPITAGGLGDHVAALAFAFGIMTALFIREKTGVGQDIDASLFQTGVYVNYGYLGMALSKSPDRDAKINNAVNNYRVALLRFYQTKDGRYIKLSAHTPADWPRVCKAIERLDLEHDPRFDTVELRMKNDSQLCRLLDEAFPGKSLEEWKPRLDGASVPWGLVKTLDEVTDDPQARACDYFISYDHPVFGKIEEVAGPVTLSRTPVKITKPAPFIGQHTEEVLLEYGYTRDEIASFKEQRIVA